MELVINIPEEAYKYILNRSMEFQAKGYTIENAILNGTPLKDQYEARLKADIVAMLSNIQLEIESKKRLTKYVHYNNLENAKSYNSGIDNCIDIIQDRINKLKGGEE